MCGDCCRDSQSRERRILLTEADVRQIEKLEVGIEFCSKDEKTAGPYTHKMAKKDGDCVFLSNNLCIIYKNRPLICRFYPFTVCKVDGYVFDVDRGCRGVGQGNMCERKYFSKLIRDATQKMSPFSR